MRTGLRFFATTFSVSLAARPAFADVRIDTVGQWGGTTYAVAMRDELAFVGIGPRVVILDLSDPTTPRRIGQTEPLSFLVANIALVDNRAFVGNAYGGFSIVDVSNPATPILVGQAEVPNGASRSQVRGLAVSGDLVFLACYETGLHIFDATNPTAPREIAHLLAGEPSLDVAVRGDFAFLTSWYGFRVFDVSDASQPRQVASLPLVPEGLTLEGNYAFVADDVYGLAVVDITVPQSPTLIGVASEPGELAVNVTVDGSYAYVADYYGGTRIYDVSDPRYPQFIVDMPSHSYAQAVAVEGGIACVCDWYTGLQILDVANPEAPREIGNFDEVCHALYAATDVRYALIGGYTPGLHVIDISDPPAATRISVLGEARHAAADVCADIVYVKEGDQGLAVYDVSSATPQFLRQISTVGVASKVWCSGDQVYVRSYNGAHRQIEIYDASAAPDLTLASVYPGGTPWDVLRDGRLLYVADAVGHLDIVDISSPDQPTLLSRRTIPSTACVLTKVGDYLYVAAYGATVFDVSDPVSPVLVTQLAAGTMYSPIASISRVGNLLCAMGSKLGVIDVSIPDSPRWVGEYRTKGWGATAAFYGGVGCLTTAESGVEIVAIHPMGDIDGNDRVDLADLALFLSAFGSVAGDERFNRYADLDRDGAVFLEDLSEFLARFGGVQ